MRCRSFGAGILQPLFGSLLSTTFLLAWLERRLGFGSAGGVSGVSRKLSNDPYLDGVFGDLADVRKLGDEGCRVVRCCIPI
jgi:hypothetical protein